MNYILNGKDIKIPDKDIDLYMKNNEISKDDAIQLWLEDEGYLDNEELDELQEKGKKVMRTIHDARKNTSKRERKPTEDKEKEFIIEKIKEFLDNDFIFDETIAVNVNITNKTKIIEFDLGENHYKIDLIRQRKPKK